MEADFYDVEGLAWLCSGLAVVCWRGERQGMGKVWGRTDQDLGDAACCAGKEVLCCLERARGRGCAGLLDLDVGHFNVFVSVRPWEI